MTIANINPAQAFQMLNEQADAVLIDVRSRAEFEYVGHPLQAVWIPWVDYPTWQADPMLFAAQVREMLTEVGGPVDDRPVLLLCRSGARSMAAAQTLAEHGFRNLYNVAEGFEGDRDHNNHRSSVSGWRFRGLPWEQS